MNDRQCGAQDCKGNGVHIVNIHNIPVWICNKHYSTLEDVVSSPAEILQTSLTERVERIRETFGLMFVSDEIAINELGFLIDDIDIPCYVIGAPEPGSYGKVIKLAYKGRAQGETEEITYLHFDAKRNAWEVGFYKMRPYRHMCEYASHVETRVDATDLSHAIRLAIGYAVQWHIQRRWWANTEDANP